MLPRACHQWLPLEINHVKVAKHRLNREILTSRRAAWSLKNCRLMVVLSLQALLELWK